MESLTGSHEEYRCVGKEMAALTSGCLPDTGLIAQVAALASLVAVALILTDPGGLVWAAGMEAVDGQLTAGRKTLNEIESQIHQQEAAREANDDARKRLQRELEEVDRELTHQQQALAVLEGEIANLTDEVASLENAVETSTTSVASQRVVLAEHLRQLHAEGSDHGRLALLVRAKQPADLIYDRHYQETLAFTVAHRISLLKEESDQLETSRKKLFARQLQLALQKEQVEEARARLEARSRQQQMLLQEAVLRGSELDNELATLAADRQRLTEMVHELAVKHQAQVADIPFAEQKGRLPWPLNGEVVSFFGHEVKGEDGRSELSNGIRVEIGKGGKVRSIYGGEVLFADWFQGYGLLIIVDHGSGYYSLYGHASGLHANVGERVEQGEVIAEIVPTTPGEELALYFEIRKDGNPVDPLHWVQGLASHADLSTE